MTSTCMIALLSAMVITGCMHRMSDREVRDVTTCEDTSKREIRKNLLLAGYTVADEEEDYLVTDYKQISESLWQRVSFVIDDADDSWRFKIRKRYEYENKIPVASTTVTTTRKSRRSRQTRQTVERSQVYQTVREVDEYDPTYYQELRDDYVRFQRQVCRRDSTPGL